MIVTLYVNAKNSKIVSLLLNLFSAPIYELEISKTKNHWIPAFAGMTNNDKFDFLQNRYY